jgi:hypothetical protein
MQLIDIRIVFFIYLQAGDKSCRPFPDTAEADDTAKEENII